MKHTSPTLLVIAALAAAPGMHALSVKDDDLSLGLKLQLQVRAEKSWASDVNGNNYNLTENVSNQESDAMDFYVRRARIGFNGTWKGEYKFAFLLRADNQDKSVGAPNATPTSSLSAGGTEGRTPQTHVAYLERIIKQESLGIEHSIRMGLDYAWFNGTSAVFSSSSFLFPTERATVKLLAPRGVGVGYKLNSKMVQWGVDIQNNSVQSGTTSGSGDAQGAANDGSADGGEGLFMGTRVQVIPYDSDEKGHMKPVESFLGKDGKGVLISAEYGVNQNDNIGNETNNTHAYGVEVLGHMDAITFLGEWRQRLTKPQIATEIQASTAYLFQVGYALPMGDQVLEPAIRWTRYNVNGHTDASGNNESAVYGTDEFGSSGYSYDVGVNYYIHGHSNKLQLAWQHWRAEDANALYTSNTTGDRATPTADIVRFQWGLSF